MVIPNLRDDERVSPSIRVSAFATAENLARRLGFRPPPSVPPSVGDAAEVTADHGLTLFDTKLADGFVHVWTGSSPPKGAPSSEAPPEGAADATDTYRGQAEVRVPWERVAEALLWNPGHALGLGVLLGGGAEMVSPSVSSQEGAVVAERERLTFALPSLSSFDPLLGNTTTARIATRADTGLTRIEAESDGGSVVTRMVVGLTPHGPYRTTVRWRGHVSGGGASTAAVGWTRVVSLGRRLGGRSGAAIEDTCDTVEDAVDVGVESLRELRRGAGAQG
jgi:hypothetical protein